MHSVPAEGHTHFPDKFNNSAVSLAEHFQPLRRPTWKASSGSVAGTWREVQTTCEHTGRSLNFEVESLNRKAIWLRISTWDAIKNSFLCWAHHAKFKESGHWQKLKHTFVPPLRQRFVQVQRLTLRRRKRIHYRHCNTGSSWLNQTDAQWSCWRSLEDDLVARWLSHFDLFTLERVTFYISLFTLGALNVGRRDSAGQIEQQLFFEILNSFKLYFFISEFLLFDACKPS